MICFTKPSCRSHDTKFKVVAAYLLQQKKRAFSFGNNCFQSWRFGEPANLHTFSSSVLVSIGSLFSHVQSH